MQPGIPSHELPAHLVRLRKMVQRMAATLSDLVDRLDAVAYEIQQIESRLSPEDTPDSLPCRRASSDDEILRAVAETGARRIDIARKPDDSAEVRIDGRKPFRLPPALADLLEILVQDRKSNDELIGWLPLESLKGMLSHRLRRTLNPHALNQLISRLRTTMREAGENPHLVQRNPRHGIRFALRHWRRGEGDDHHRDPEDTEVG